MPKVPSAARFYTTDCAARSASLCAGRRSGSAQTRLRREVLEAGKGKGRGSADWQRDARMEMMGGGGGAKLNQHPRAASEKDCGDFTCSSDLRLLRNVERVPSPLATSPKQRKTT
jgi:hypothetical protein